MNLRFLAHSALAIALSAASLPAFAELIVDRASPQPASRPASVGASLSDEGIIEFKSAPSNKVSIRETAPAPRNGDIAWRNWSKQPTAAGQTDTSTQGGSIDRGAALGLPKVVASTQSPVTGRVSELGREQVPASALTQTVQGWADEIPLDMALSQVVPADWSIQARGLNLKGNISWRGDRPWVEVLSDLTRQGRFNANVVWDRKVVVVFPVGALEGTAISPIASAPQHTSAPVVQPVLVPAAPLVKSWKIDPSKTLRGNIESWVKQAGWNTLVWEAADYPIVAPATLEGEFTSPTGPLAKLIEAYRDSDQPLEVKLSTMDKVVHVTNKNYEAATVTPMTPQGISPASFEK
jgi:hypothetical protein